MVQISEIKVGTRVFLHTKKGDFECIILESSRSDILLVKLDSGYNIGVREEDILDIKLVKEKIEKDETGKKEKESVKAKSDKKNNLPNIVLIATGGTISSKLDYKTGGVKWLTDVEELLKFYPEILKIANIKKIETPFMKASENMEFSDWEILAEIAAEYLNKSDVDGIIITHGTDFLHYSASALSFTLQNLNKPVVLTYSQRSSDRASSDARLNLICAARAAVSDIAEVMLVGHANLDDEYCYALSGTKVRKMHSSRRDTFRSINSSPIAKVFADKVEVISHFNPRDNSKKVELKNKFSDKVALVKFYPGQNPEILEYYQSNGYKGVVVEMSGLGHVLTGEAKNNWLPKLKKVINSGFIVCAAPQTIYGGLDPMVYSAGRDIEKTGVIYLNDMLPETAFVKLGWVFGQLIGKGIDNEKVKKMMLTNYSKEFNDRISDKEFLN
ncbi:MAG TPA: Glu-tRNA(Gln) amidotransferase subunit GatD [Candidatus Paceibacterota bacterium]|nr:Glu-tRNA(Gln) amidotransferase subunit GatD [Candidatus Paceibacterota bacterium]